MYCNMWFIRIAHYFAEIVMGSADSRGQPNPQTNKETN